MSNKKFNPEKRKRLNNPERLEWLAPSKIWELLENKNPNRIIDIGAGTGYFTLALSENLSDTTIYALDIEPIMIQEMEESLPGDCKIIPQLMQNGEITQPDDSVDIVWLINLYHEVEDTEQLLKEIYRVLKKDGELFIADWDKSQEACEHGPSLDHRVSLEKILQDLDNLNFKNVRIGDGFKFHYGVAASK